METPTTQSISPLPMGWKAVAPYYTHSSPNVQVHGKSYAASQNAMYFIAHADDRDRPSLREFEEMTEEEARDLYGLIGQEFKWEDDWGSAKDFILSDDNDEGSSGHAIWNLKRNALAAHYLISRNINVFEVPTYEGEQAKKGQVNK